MKTVVLFHAQCQDGFASAYAAWTVLGDDADYIPVQYGQPPPLDRVRGDCEVLYILDFSYDRAILVNLAKRFNRVVVLDHHKTAREALESLEAPGLSITFDMEKSGAVLAWEYFHPGEAVPLLLRYVEDRDLWRWRLPLSREFSAGLSVKPREFLAWRYLQRCAEEFGDCLNLIDQGKAILLAERQHVESLASQAYLMDLGGHEVWAVNSPIFQSEIGERLCELHPDSLFSAVFFLTKTDYIWSLRSRHGFDVSAVARAFGGGGHAAAAGFKVPRGKSSVSISPGPDG